MHHYVTVDMWPVLRVLFITLINGSYCFQLANSFHRIGILNLSHKLNAKFTCKNYGAIQALLSTRLFSSDKPTSEKRKWMMDHFHVTVDKLHRKLEDERWQRDDYSKLEARSTWLQERPDLKDKNMKKIVHRYPNVLKLKSEANLEPMLNYF